MNRNILHSSGSTIPNISKGLSEVPSLLKTHDNNFKSNNPSLKPMTVTSYKDLKTLFPLKESFSYRPIIVWAMNDRLNKQELDHQLASFKATGYGGVMVMPWGGLPYLFMSTEWLEAVRYILERATDLDLDIWLWDDWLYGSGPADGEVTRNPAYRAKTLKILVDIVLEPGESTTVMIPPRTIFGSLFPVNKFGNPTGNSFEPISITTSEPMHFKAEIRMRLMIVGWEYISGMQHTTRSHSRFLDPNISDHERNIYVCDDAEVWSVDMLNPDAIARYVELIHERYWDAMPQFFGNTLKGFFYDEPKSATGTPWTQQFAEEFKKRKGYDLLPYLPSMMVVYRQDGGNFTERFRPEEVKKAEVDYRDVWTTLLAESFYGTIQRWCRKHKVIATGHPIGDNSLAEIFSNGGYYFKNMAFSDMPGVDTVGGFNNTTLDSFFDFPRFPGSRATLLGKTRAMSESFAVYGHGLYLDQMRFVCAHQIIRNVNTFFCKLSNYNREKSFFYHPPELSDYNPVIKYFGSIFCEWIENVSGLMNTGEMVSPRIALYIGTWNFYRGDLAIAQYTTQIAQILTYHQIEFDYVWDQDVLEMHTSTTGIEGKSGQIYRCVIVPQNVILPPEIKSKFEEWEKKDFILDLEKVDLNHLGSVCRTKAKALLNVLSSNVNISMRSRKLDEGIQCSLFLNESSIPQRLTIKTTSTTNVFDIDLNTWQINLLTKLEPELPFEVKLRSSEARMYLFDASGRYTAPHKQKNTVLEEIPLQNLTVITPDHKTLELASPLPSWNELGYPGYTGFMRYRCRFLWKWPTGRAQLSLGDLRYAARILLNGQIVGNCVFSPFEMVLENLTTGEHVLEIDVLNTQANTVFGDPETFTTLRKLYDGTYAPLYEKLDRAKLSCGLLGPITLHRLSDH
jgi:hypothetical protein